MSIKKFNKTTGKWEIQGTGIASEIALLDMEGNFQSGNVEGALNESARKIKEQEIINNANTSLLQTHASVLKTHQEDIEWLKENGGGGSGGSAPTITSTFEDNTIIQKGEELVIPIFFSSPNLGEGLAYVMIDGVEVKTEPVKQGNNRVNVGTLSNLKNEVSIYVKDRSGSLSNQLMWNVICGGLEVTVDFDSDADYTVDDIIVMKYTIQTASEEPIYMHMKVGYTDQIIECKKGENEFVFKNLGVGVHKVSFYVTSGIYTSPVTTFNIVIVNSTSLYVSSVFEGGEFEYGTPIPINYRISKMGNEEFTVKLILDDVVVKTLRATAGSYFWTLNDTEIGEHKIVIDVTSDYGENAFVEKEFTIVQGEYTPVRVTESGLIYRLNAEGKTNNDIDRDNPVDSSGNGVKTTLHNFNYFTNGWVNDSLICDGDAYVEIDCYPWANNATYGSTIEIQYKGLDIGIDDARIFDYTDIETPYKGAYIDLNESTMKSLANTGKVNVDKDAWTTLTFVIDRKAKFGKIFINGICSRAFSLSDSGSGVNAIREDFTHQQKIYLNSRKGLDKFGACEIKDLRIYDRVLTDDEIVLNNIAQEKNLEKQRVLYNKNYNNTTLPTIRMYGDTSKMTLETPVPMRIKYTSPNDELYGQSFDLPYCDVNWQGTSSLQYVLKNFTVRLKDENMADYEYTPYPNGVPETVYCFKCDYMESTHSRNAGLAKFVNECLYDSKNPAQLKDEKVRNTINGFPTLLYINDELQGVYNFNLDRYSTKSYGYEDDGKCLVYEVSANSDTTAGAFHKWTQETGKDKLDYYKSDFECLFPPTRASGNDNMEELIRVIEWVNDASDEDFRDNIHNYFNKEYLLRYYLYVLVVGAVDSLGKNMKLATWDGRIWYPQVYDADTTIGLDNTGFLKFDMDIEMGDPHVFNTTGSKLWQKVRVLFEKELQEQYALMRQKHFTVDNFMKYLLGQQIEQIPARYYNIDMQTKYLNYGSSYLYALHGSGEQHIRKWLRERLIYVDTLLGYNVSTSDYITLRSSKLGEVYLDIETYIPMYVRVKWRDEAGGTGVQVKRVARGEKVRFSYNMPTATDQEIIVYGGYYLKSIGNVSNLQPTTMLIANASRLTEIECHSPNLINTDLSECTKLQRIDLSDCTALGTGIGSQPILNIQNCNYLRYCNCSNTKLTAIYTMQRGGNLEEIYFPESTQVVQVTNQTHLKRLGLPLDVENDIYCKNLATVQISNCKSIQTIHYPFNEDDDINFDAFKYVQSLTIDNSLDNLKEISFTGFSKLKNVTLGSLNNLTKLGFDDMLPTDEVSTLNSITISNIPQVDTLSFNVSSNDYKVEFAKDAKIDIGGLLSCKTLESNYSIKGLDTILLPVSIKNVYLSTEFGDGENEIKNLWSANAIHDNDGFTGIDFLEMEINDFAMSGCKYLKKAINFYLYPINTIPDLSALEEKQGGINLDAYIGDVRYLFKDLDFTNPEFIISLNKNIQKTDITGLFQNSIITNEIAERLLRHFPNAIIWDYLFNNSTIEKDITIPSNIISVVDGFKDCSQLTHIRSNWNNEFEEEIVATGCYSGCTNITHIDDEELNLDEDSTPLDFVPITWGGYGFTKEYTSIIEVVIPSDNFEFDLTENGTRNPAYANGYDTINWGDGTVTNGVYKHTFAKAGTYRIKGHYHFYYDLAVSVDLRTTVTKVLQVATHNPDTTGNIGITFQSMSAVEEINITGIDTVRYNFQNCSSLSRIIGLKLTDKCKNTEYMFNGCTSLTNVENMQIWDMSNVTTIRYMFSGSGITDYSGLTNWTLTNCINANNCFENTVADTIDISGWDNPILNNVGGLFFGSRATTLNVTNLINSACTSVNGMFQNSYATEIIGTETWDVSNVVNYDSFLRGSKVIEFNISNWKLSSNINSYNVIHYESALQTLIANNIDCDPSTFNKWYNSTDSAYSCRATKVVMDEILPTMKNFSGMFEGNSNLRYDIEFPTWVTDVSNAFKDCTNLNYVTSNWKTDYSIYADYTDTITLSAGRLNQDGSVTVNKSDKMSNHIKTLDIGLKITLDTSYDLRLLAYDENEKAIYFYDWNTSSFKGRKESGTFILKTNGVTIDASTIPEDVKSIRYCTTGLPKKYTVESATFLNATDCYSGCTNITHVDGEEFTNDYPITILETIPLDWGGEGLIMEELSFFTVEIDTDGTTVTIANLIGNGYINWGDGTITRGETTHTYNAGTYKAVGRTYITGNGSCSNIMKNYVTRVDKLPTAKFNYSTSFNGTVKLVYVNLNGVQSSNCYKLFQDSSVEVVDVTNFDIDGDTRYLFTNATKLRNIIGFADLGSPDVTIGGEQFMRNTPMLEIHLDLRKWKPISGGNAFNGCGATSVDISGWDNFPDSDIFMGMPNLTTITARNVDLSKTTTLSAFMQNNKNLKTIDFTGTNTSTITNMSNMFNGCTNFTDSSFVENLDVSSVTNFSSMLKGCGFTRLDLSSWNANKGVNFASFVEGSPNLTEINVTNLVKSSATSLVNFFLSCKLLSNIIGLGTWNVNSVTNMASMFSECSKITELSGLEDWRTESLTNVGSMFNGCTIKNIDLSNWHPSNITVVMRMFINCKYLTSVDMTGWDMSNVTAIDGMFQNCSSLIEIKGSETWNAPKLSVIAVSFYNCNKLTNLDLSGCDVSNVTNFTNVFHACNSMETFNSFKNIKFSLTINASTKITAESLMSVINNLMTVTTTQKLTIGATNLAKLTDEQKAIAINKGWTLV